MRNWVAAVAVLALASCGREDPPANTAAPATERVAIVNSAIPAPAAPAPAPSTAAPDGRFRDVMTAVSQAVGEIDPKARVGVGYADIGGDEREEALVYLVDPGRCGTGGCSLLVLTPSGKGWRKIGETSVTQLPVHRLLTRKDGWNDLAVGIGGGGGAAGTALLRFANGRYPANPSVQPILNRLPEGARLVIADDYDALVPAH